MKQTAVEWLKKELEDYGSNSHLSLGWNTFDELFEQAIEMEKQQLNNAYNDDRPNLCCYEENTAFKEYYKETFKSKKNEKHN